MPGELQDPGTWDSCESRRGDGPDELLGAPVQLLTGNQESTEVMRRVRLSPRSTEQDGRVLLTTAPWPKRTESFCAAPDPGFCQEAS